MPKPSIADIPQLLRIADVAKYLDVSAETVRREVHRGRLRYTRIGRSIRFRPEHVLEYIENQTAGPSDEDRSTTGSGTARGAGRGLTAIPGKRDALASAHEILTRSRSGSS